MTKFLTALLVLSLMLVHADAQADSEADSLASKFGRKRVKIQRAETPLSVTDARMQTVQKRYQERVLHCRGQTDRNKQYCLMEAEQELRMSERRLRDEARAKAASKADGEDE